MSKDNDNEVLMSQATDGTLIVTSATEPPEWNRQVQHALATYDPKNTAYTAYLNLSGTANDLTQAVVSQYANNAQSSLDNIVSLNAIIRHQVNTNDLIGMVVQSIENNVNTDYTLTYNKVGDKKSVTKKLNKAKEIIDDFLSQINVKKLIREATGITFCEGNYNCQIRQVGTNWTIEYLPLGVVEMSGYNSNGRPILLMNTQNLRDALTKTMIKNKGGKPVFFKDTNEEIENSFPAEVYKGIIDRETYVRLSPDYTGTCRINNRGRAYGLSPITRALNDVIMLQNLYNADTVTAKSKSKKIIHQVMRKEVMGKDYTNKGFDLMAYAHQQLMKAWTNPTVVYTSPPSVEKIVYVEPKTDEISADKVQLYRNKVLSSLGVSFLSNDFAQTGDTAQISLKQLLQCINRITEQVEDMLNNFFRTVLTVNNIDLMYCPTISIVDSEMLETGMKIELATYLYNCLNCSMETAFGMVGIDITDEKRKREAENQAGLDKIFFPHSTAYTKSGKDKTDNVNNQIKEKQANDAEGGADE